VRPSLNGFENGLEVHLNATPRRGSVQRTRTIRTEMVTVYCGVAAVLTWPGLTNGINGRL